MILDQCSECGGRLRLAHITRDERIERHLGGAWVARCQRCATEVTVKPDAWRRFVRARKQQQHNNQPSLF